MDKQYSKVDKGIIRTQVKELKRQFSPSELEQKSHEIFRVIEDLKEFKEAIFVLLYWSLPDEVNTHQFILKWHKRKKIVLPVIIGNDLDLRLFENSDFLIPSSSFGIMEPQRGETINPSYIDLAIIPGIGFDLKGNRLGRGKGFYDRLLPSLTAYKIGISFDFQIFKEIPISKSDVPVDLVVYK